MRISLAWGRRSSIMATCRFAAGIRIAFIALAQHASSVGEVVHETARSVERIVAEGQTPLVLGGDCTIELGTVAGFLNGGSVVGLIYLDLHPDLNVPAAVPDGALDWMGTAHLLGVDGAVESLVRAGPAAPMLSADRLVLLGYGPAETTAFEREVIERRRIRAIPVDEAAAAPECYRRGRAGRSCLLTVDSVLVHFDVDIVDFARPPRVRGAHSEPWPDVLAGHARPWHADGRRAVRCPDRHRDQPRSRRRGRLNARHLCPGTCRGICVALIDDVHRGETGQEALGAVADELDGDFLVAAALGGLDDQTFAELGMEDLLSGCVGHREHRGLSG